MFFGFANVNGTITTLAYKIRYGLRKATWLGPISVYLLALGLTVCGASGLVVAPFTYSLAVALGINPFLGVAACAMGSMSLILFPFLQTGATNLGIVTGYFSQEQAFAAMYHTGLSTLLFFAIEYVALTFIFKAYKTSAKQAAELDPPPPFTPIQRTNLIVLGVVMVLLLVPSIIQTIAPNPVTKWITSVLSIQFLWTAGTIVLALLNCGNLQEVLMKRVSWNTLFMVTGMSILFGLADDMGVVEVMKNALFKVPAWALIPLLASFTAILSLFVSGSIINPMFIAFAQTFVDITGLPLTVVIAAICGGAGVTSVSPISTGGATALIGCTDEDKNPTIVKQMTTLALCNIVLAFFYYLLQTIIFR